jgi:hypothetical protein
MQYPERILRVDDIITEIDLATDACARDISEDFEFDNRMKNLTAAKGILWGFMISVPLWLLAGIMFMMFIQ